MGIIHIKNLKLKTIIGINPPERQKKQEIILNIKISFSSQKAQKSDKIDDTVDYHKLAEKIIEKSQNKRFFLLEKLANHILEIILEDRRIGHAEIEIDKAAALPYADSVSFNLKSSRPKNAKTSRQNSKK